MRGIIDATCERCGQQMQWDTLNPRVCKDCRLCGLGLHPEQIAKAEGQFEEWLEDEAAYAMSWQPVIVVVKPR
jgi:hypothetical protein